MILKYKKLIAEILKIDFNRIKFYSEQNITYTEAPYERTEFKELGELYYYKPDTEGYTRETGIANWSLGSYRVTVDNKIISTWKLYQLPHCCAYMISCNVYIDSEYRNLGLGTILNLLRIDIGKLLGYSALLCTDIGKNICQRKILKKNNWKDIHSVKNKRTNNLVFLSVIDLL